jgi:hypothetical protein
MYGNLQSSAPRTHGLLFWAFLIPLWLCIATPGWAASASSGFAVTINYVPNSSGTAGGTSTAYCRVGNGIGSFGTTVVALCTTGQIVNFTGDASKLQWMTLPVNSYQYMINPVAEGQSPGTFDIYTSYGSYTSWRLVRLSHRDYYELMVHW